MAHGAGEVSAAIEPTAPGPETGGRGSCLRRLFNQPINRLLMVAFTLVALVPLVFLAIQLYKVAWVDAWREIQEKHRLLAMNLAAPISIYIKDHRAALGLLATTLTEAQRQIPLTGSPGLAAHPRALMEAASTHLTDFRIVTLMDTQGRVLFSSLPGSSSIPSIDAKLKSERCFTKTLQTGKPILSGIKASPFDGKPTLVQSYPVMAPDGSLAGVLLGELRIAPIEAVRKQIHFGKKGHSAIVDQFGHVVAHPNPAWMTEMRDLSHLSVVKLMLAGGTGVTEFYSPFIKQDMVAGYTSIRDLGWGIMVPQPKSEVIDRVNNFLYTEFAWMGFGLVLAVLLAWALARWITLPLKRLAGAATRLKQQDYQGILPASGDNIPCEIRDLNLAMGHLVAGLQHTYHEIDSLNRELQDRVNDATSELREANGRLAELANVDYLTQLANRRFFEESMTRTLKQRRMSDIELSLIMLDVDHFKRLNDAFGHAAGDTVLVGLAEILRTVTRDEDLAVRYAGDEFVVWMQCGQVVAEQRAMVIQQTIAETSFEWQGHPLDVTVSIGVTTLPLGEVADAEELFHRVDQAMYRAKEGGRNRIAD